MISHPLSRDKEIPDNIFAPTKKASPMSNLDTNADYKVGEKIIHTAFGEGIIVSVEKSIINIAFPHPIGIKTIMKGHKSIRKV